MFCFRVFFYTVFVAVVARFYIFRWMVFLGIVYIFGDFLYFTDSYVPRKHQFLPCILKLFCCCVVVTLISISLYHAFVFFMDSVFYVWRKIWVVELCNLSQRHFGCYVADGIKILKLFFSWHTFFQFPAPYSQLYLKIWINTNRNFKIQNSPAKYLLPQNQN